MKPPSSAALEMLDDASVGRAASRLATLDPALDAVHQQLGPPPLWRRPATFGTLVRIILEQQVSLRSAAATFALCRQACGGRVTTTSLTQLGEEGLRAIGFSRQKARYAITLAADIRRRQFSIRPLARLPDHEVRERITERLGLGEWSANVFLMMALLRPDVLPTGDRALAVGLRELDGGDYSDGRHLTRRAEVWRPHRSVAVRMVWHHYLNRRGQTFD